MKINKQEKKNKANKRGRKALCKQRQNRFLISFPLLIFYGLQCKLLGLPVIVLKPIKFSLKICRVESQTLV